MVSAFVQGLRTAVQRWPIVLLLFLASVASALSFTAAAWSWLSLALDSSVATRTLLTDLDVNVFIDLFVQHGESLRMLVPVTGLLLSMLCLWSACFAGTGMAMLVLLAPAAFFGQFYMGAGYGTASLQMPADMRGTTMAILLISFNLISVTAGASIVGGLSDMLRPSLGVRSIAVSIAATGLFSLLAAIFFARAMVLLRRDERTA